MSYNLRKRKAVEELDSPVSRRRIYSDSDDEDYTEEYKNTRELVRLRGEIARDIPSLSQIIKANILDEDKKRAIILHDIMATSPLEQYYEYAAEIKQIISYEMNGNLEQLNTIKQRLDNSNKTLETNTLNKILTLNCDEETRARIYDVFLKFSKMSKHNSEYSLTREKLAWYTSLPYQNTTLLCNDNVADYCGDVKRILDEELYGMEHVKSRILEYINNRLRNPNANVVIALKGPPGVGKTAICSAIAKALGLPFWKMGLGGLKDATAFKGSETVWLGSRPSIFLRALRAMKCSNGVFLMDEIDKLGSNFTAEAEAALLHALDPAENQSYGDAFLSEIKHNISRMWMVVTMNDDRHLSKPLKDRLDIIEVPRYNPSETGIIIKKHLLPKVLAECGLENKDVEISNEAVEKMVARREDGLRDNLKVLGRIVSKLSLENTIAVSNSTIPGFQGFPYVINEECLDMFLPHSESHVQMMYG